MGVKKRNAGLPNSDVMRDLWAVNLLTSISTKGEKGRVSESSSPDCQAHSRRSDRHAAAPLAGSRNHTTYRSAWRPAAGSSLAAVGGQGAVCLEQGQCSAIHTAEKQARVR